MTTQQTASALDPALIELARAQHGDAHHGPAEGWRGSPPGSGPTSCPQESSSTRAAASTSSSRWPRRIRSLDTASSWPERSSSTPTRCSRRRRRSWRTTSPCGVPRLDAADAPAAREPHGWRRMLLGASSTVGSASGGVPVGSVGHRRGCAWRSWRVDAGIAPGLASADAALRAGLLSPDDLAGAVEAMDSWPRRSRAVSMLAARRRSPRVGGGVPLRPRPRGRWDPRRAAGRDP